MNWFVYPHEWVFPLVYAILSIALVGCVVRLIIGPTPYDRIVASDLISAVIMCIAAVYALETGHRIFFDIALAIAVIAFLGAIAFSRHLERLSIQESGNNASLGEADSGGKP